MANEFKIRKGLIVHGSGSTILDIQGSQGQLFSVTDNLTGESMGSPLYLSTTAGAQQSLAYYLNDLTRRPTLTYTAVTGYGNTVIGVAGANIDNVIGVASGGIDNIIGV